MNRKHLSIIVISAMALSLAACGKEAPASVSETSVSVSTEASISAAIETSVEEELVVSAETVESTETTVTSETTEPEYSEPTFYEYEDMPFEDLEVVPETREFKDLGTISYMCRTIKCALCGAVIGEYYGEYIDFNSKIGDKAGVISQSVKEITMEKYDSFKEKQVFFAESSIDCGNFEHTPEPGWDPGSSGYARQISDIRFFGGYMAVDLIDDEDCGWDHFVMFGGCLLYNLKSGELIELSDIFPGTEEDFKKIAAEKTKEDYLSEDSTNSYGRISSAGEAYDTAYDYCSFERGVEFLPDGVNIVFNLGWLDHPRYGFMRVFISYEDLRITAFSVK